MPDTDTSTSATKEPYEETAPGQAVKAKNAAKSKKRVVKPLHPPYASMISAAIASMKERGGSSRYAILKYILANNKVRDEKKASVQVNLAIRRMLAAKIIFKVKGSFKLAKVKKPKEKRMVKKLIMKEVVKKSKRASKNYVAKKKSKKSVAKNAPKKTAVNIDTKTPVKRSCMIIDVKISSKKTAKKLPDKKLPTKKHVAKKVASMNITTLKLDPKIKATMKYQLKVIKCREPVLLPGPIRKTHDFLCSWIVETTPPPETILDLINYLKDLKDFSESTFIKDLLAITCLEAILQRRPSVIEGAWEELFLTISSFDYDIDMCDYGTLFSLECIQEWLPKYCSQTLCPNPFLRLKLFRYLSDFCIFEVTDEGILVYNENLISMLFELHDKFSHFEINDINKCSTVDFKKVMESNFLRIGKILNSSLSTSKKQKVIESIVKITKMLATIEVQFINRFRVQAQDTAISCLSFCGLLRDYFGDEDYDNDLRRFAEVVTSNSNLIEYVEDIICLLGTTLPNLNKECSRQVTKQMYKIISFMAESEAKLLPSQLNCLPRNLSIRELNGITPLTVNEMLLFTSLKNEIDMRLTSDTTDSNDEFSDVIYSSEDEWY